MSKRLDDKQLATLATEVRRLKEQTAILTSELAKMNTDLREKSAKLNDALGIAAAA